MCVPLRKLRYILARRDVWQLARLLCVVCLMVLLELAGIFSVLPFMQLVSKPELADGSRWLNWIDATFNFSSRREMLIWMGFALLGIQTVTAVSNVFTSWMIQRTIWGIGHRISMRLLNRYAQLPYEFFLTRNTSAMVKKAISDIQSLVSGVLLAGSKFIANAFKSLCILLLLFFVSPGLALVAFVTYGGVYVLMHALRHKRLERLGRARLDTILIRFKSFTETLLGLKTLRVSGSTEWFIRRFESASRRFSKLQPLFQLYSVVPRYLIELLAFGGIIGFILYLLLTHVEFLAVIPTLSVFAMATYKLLPALSQAFTQAAAVSHNLPVIDAVHEDMQDGWVLLKPAEDFSRAQPLPFQRGFTLEGVSFQYASSGIPVLTDINLEIAKSSKCAFVGSTGCGKSTLVDIMVGLLCPTAGRVLVDATPITVENVYGWQQRIAYVPQDVFLYDDSVAANIALGIPVERRDQQLLRKSARLAQVDEFITTELKDGYDTTVGDRGVRLSGGERQRIGLARAFYRQPDVLFLDEATSALDSITEEAVVSAIEREMPDLTLVMIAHRLSSIKFCDEVMLIDSGRVVAHGTFDELMKSNAKFRQMVEITE